MINHMDCLHFGFRQQMMTKVTHMFVQLTQIQNFLWSPWRFDNYPELLMKLRKPLTWHLLVYHKGYNTRIPH